MGSQGNDPTVVHSSIALLQERFRQLQRVKEMREERKLIREFAAADTEPTQRQPQPKWFSHPDLVRPSRPLSGPPAHRGEQPEFRALETSLSMGLWHNRPGASRPGGGETDVDTSLHL